MKPLQGRIQMPDGKTNIEIRAIMAIDSDGVLGYDNDIIFNNPVDLKWFKDKTTGKVCVMGRKTFESIGAVLPNRQSVIITRNPKEYTETLKKFESKLKKGTPMPIATNNPADDLPRICDQYGTNKVWITGGAEIFKLFDKTISTYVVTEYRTKLLEEDEIGHINGVELGYLPDYDEYDELKITKIDKTLLTHRSNRNLLERGEFEGLKYTIVAYSKITLNPFGTAVRPKSAPKMTFAEIEEANREDTYL